MTSVGEIKDSRTFGRIADKRNKFNWVKRLEECVTIENYNGDGNKQVKK